MKTPSNQKNQQTDSGEELYSLTPVTVPKQSALGAGLPTWIRLPKAGAYCRYSSLSRSTLNGLILGPNPPVTSISLKKRFAIRGCRLIHRQSLMDYLDSLAESQGNQPEKEGDE